jgi:mannose-6-phosphate isomerase-like protein (cupin superfamily)
MQAPHLEDEVYFVVSGRATLKVGGQEQEVSAGKILFVRATSEHTFFNIEEDLTLVAIFGAARPM